MSNKADNGTSPPVRGILILMDPIPSLPSSTTFEAFLGEGLDRCAFISAWLRARAVPHSVVDLAGKRHLVVRFDQSAYDPHFRMKTLVAHYDRAPDTPGANDNSAACFQLMLFAAQLAGGGAGTHNIRLFFTDGEEAAGTKGITGQGAFALGSGMRKLKMTGDDVYVFDACGRGDTLVLSTAGIDESGRSPFNIKQRSLHERTVELARRVSRENWVRLPTPYSDNAGFIASGIPAQVITVLPHPEAATLLQCLATAPAERARLIRVITGNHRLEEGSADLTLIPETWRLMHTTGDSAATLSASAFRLVGRFLAEIAARRDSEGI